MVLATYFDMGSSTCPRLLSHSSSPGLQHIIMDSYKEDDARAGTVEIEDITRCKGNRQILRRLKGDDVTFSRVVVLRGHGYNDYYHVVDNHPNSTASDGYYVPRATDDLGWLGYYISKSSRLKELSVWRDSVTNVQLKAFCRLLAANASLERIWFLDRGSRGAFPAEVLPMLTRFFGHNHSLTNVTMWNGCVADLELEALAPALENMRRLKVLDLSHNTSITVRGYRSLSALLRNTDSCLEEVRLSHNNVDDEVTVVLAEALTQNQTVKVLSLHGHALTFRGWSPFSKLLCDVSSPDATFLSNHTLQSIHGGAPDGVRFFLKLNRGPHVARTKLLAHHPVLDVRPRRAWEYKLLPLVVGWLERAAAAPASAEADLDGRKLATLRRFVRGYPEEYFRTRGGPWRRKRSRPAGKN